MNAPVVTAADVTTSMTGVTSTGFTDFTTPRKIIAAAVGDGAGTYDVAPEILKLVVPANTLVGRVLHGGHDRDHVGAVTPGRPAGDDY